MTLWDQLQSLQGQEQAQIGELLGKYPLELEVQSHLAAWLEVQRWDEAVDNNDQEQVERARNLLVELLNVLRTKAKQATPLNRTLEAMILINKLNDTANNIEMKYANNPTLLANIMKQLLIAEQQMIMSQTQQLVDGMEATEEVAQQSEMIANMLTQNSQEMEQVVKTLEQQKETYVIQFEDIRSKIVLLESKYKEIESNLKLPQNVKEDGLSRCKSDMEKMWASVKQMAEELLGQRNDAIEKLKRQLKHFEEFQENIIGEIINWKYSQKIAHCGFPEPGPLDEIKKHCEALAELEWRGYTHTTQVENLFLQVLQNNKAELSRMTEIKNAYKCLLTKLIEGAFVIEKQPPQVLKTQTKFTSTVRHLIGSKLNMQMSKPEVTATIITERQAEELSKTGTWKSQGQDEILNNKKVMEYVQEKDCVVAEFKNMSLKKVNRQGKKNTERVMDEKSTLLFQAHLHIGGEKFSVMQLSLPVSVIVHGNQQPEAEGTIFWDNAFSDVERTPFEVRDVVYWQEFTVALNARWAMANNLHLIDTHLDYLASKLYGARPLEGYQNHPVKKDCFNKDYLPDRQFTFWIWFYHIMDLVKKNFLQEWQEGLIAGFISKDNARDMLLQKPVGTFLLRFSDGILGGISVAYVIMDQAVVQWLLNREERNRYCDTNKGKLFLSGLNGDDVMEVLIRNLGVWNIEPWSYRDLSKRNLSDRIKDLEELRYLYPNVPKDEAFGAFYSKTEEHQQFKSPDDYVPSNLTCNLPWSTRLQGNIGSPHSVASTDSHMDPSSPLATEIFSSDMLGEGAEVGDVNFDLSSILLPGFGAATLDFDIIEQVLGNFSAIQVIDKPDETAIKQE